MKKRGQMKISFGMIFSLILIAAFIAFAIYAISIFINVSDEAKIATFIDDLQKDVDRVWKSAEGSQPREYTLPSKIEKICFVDRVNENLIFYPLGSVASDTKIENLDISKTLDDVNTENGELCFENDNGFTIILKKEYGEDLVYIRKP